METFLIFQGIILLLTLECFPPPFKAVFTWYKLSGIYLDIDIKYPQIFSNLLVLAALGDMRSR